MPTGSSKSSANPTQRSNRFAANAAHSPQFVGGKDLRPVRSAETRALRHGWTIGARRGRARARNEQEAGRFPYCPVRGMQRGRELLRLVLASTCVYDSSADICYCGQRCEENIWISNNCYNCPGGKYTALGGGEGDCEVPTACSTCPAGKYSGTRACSCTAW